MPRVCVGADLAKPTHWRARAAPSKLPLPGVPCHAFRRGGLWRCCWQPLRRRLYCDRPDCSALRRGNGLVTRCCRRSTTSSSLSPSVGGARMREAGWEVVMAGPLEGVRVIDFGQYVAGPLAGMLLADFGAEVVHVDPPGGPRWPTSANVTWNRGKRCMVLDLKRADDHAAARRLVASADIVVENFRPGVMERLGLGPAALTAADPRLIYCSLPGFAADDPRAAVPAWEGVVAAATGTYRPAPDGPPDRPLYTAIPISSHFAAILGAISVAMALIARDRDGLGQRIEVPLFDATFAAIGAHGLLVEGRPAGDRPVDSGNGRCACADGRWVHFSGSTPRFRQRLVEATGNQQWRDEGLLDLARLRADAALAAALRARLRAL